MSFCRVLTSSFGSSVFFTLHIHVELNPLHYKIKIKLKPQLNDIPVFISD